MWGGDGERLGGVCTTFCWKGRKNEDGADRKKN